MAIESSSQSATGGLRPRLASKSPSMHYETSTTLMANSLETKSLRRNIWIMPTELVMRLRWRSRGRNIATKEGKKSHLINFVTVQLYINDKCMYLSSTIVSTCSSSSDIPPMPCPRWSTSSARPQSNTSTLRRSPPPSQTTRQIVAAGLDWERADRCN